MSSDRKCCMCKRYYCLSPENFYRNKSGHLGFDSWCKLCRKKYNFEHKQKRQDYFREYHRLHFREKRKVSRDYYYSHKKEKAEYGKLYRSKNKTVIQVRDRKYREENIDRIKDANKIYRRKNKKKISIKQKLYRALNSELIKKKKHDYYCENKAKIMAHQRYRLKTDVNCRMSANLRSRLWSALMAQKAIKTNHTMQLVGCSVEFLKRYLASRFSDGMSWDNYGKNGWTIDHIKPCALFDLTKEEGQKKCFNYKNLTPMWNTDNCKKNSFYNGKRITTSRRV